MPLVYILLSYELKNMSYYRRLYNNIGTFTIHINKINYYYLLFVIIIISFGTFFRYML